MKRARREGKGEAPYDADETREHIMAAGRELLLAARGALGFCREYVETSVPEGSRANLISFFQKAMAVADELSRGICGAETLKKAAGAAAGPLFTAMAREMSAQGGRAKAGQKEKPCRRDTRRSSSATRTASSTTRRTRATSRSRT
ncbi:MAG TPA: hypothetical protein PLY45_00135 [bacterium]|nr:hypothetical protein [bacterium]